MIVVGKRGRKAGRPGRSSRVRRRRLRLLLVLGSLVLILGALGAAFLAGGYAQRNELLTDWSDPLSDWGMKYDPRRVGNYLEAHLTGAKLPTLQIDIKFKHLSTIEMKRNEALRRGVLLTSDKDFVPANFRVGELSVPGKLRLKGDNLDHLRSEKRSLRIHLKGNATLLGLRRFSIQHPMTRNYHLEWAFHENARLEGLMTPRYRFVEVVFNGTSKGIYALEEHFSKDLMEAHGRREGVILKFDEAPGWINRARGGMTIAKHISERLAPRDVRQTSISTYQERRLAQNPELARQRDAGISLLRELLQGSRLPSEAFDPELTGRFLALVDLWSAGHALNWNNLRFYYNPITTLLEPVPFDAVPDLMTPRPLIVRRDEEFVRGFWGILLADPTIAAAYVRSLARMSDPSYLKELKSGLEKPLEEILSALHREWPALDAPWDRLERNQPFVRGALNPAAWAVATLHRESREDAVAARPPLVLEVSNLLSLPVELIGYRVNDSELIRAGEGRVLLPPAPHRDLSLPVELSVNHEAVMRAAYAGAPLPQVDVVVRMIGREKDKVIPARILLAGPRRLDLPTVEEALTRHSFLERTGSETELRVKPGTWDVASDLVLPRGVGLNIGPGTTLRFVGGAMIYATGPLRWKGTEDEPIQLVPIYGSWPGIMVDRAGGRSLLKHVVISNTAGIDREGWKLTSGTTFYRSSVTISQCRFTGSSASDLISIIRAEFELIGSEFGPCDSDAFDGEFVTGRIENCGFHDTRGDAVDLSGSTVHLLGLNMRKIGDKAISAGENSEVTAGRLSLHEVGIAMASKDRSRLTVRDAEIRGARIGFAAYFNKSHFGAAVIDAMGISFDDVKREALVQEGSKVRLNGKTIPGEPLDAQQLYEHGVRGN